MDGKTGIFMKEILKNEKEQEKEKKHFPVEIPIKKS
jgi:hypothetical protein